MSKVAVIGGGASGLVAAYYAAANEASVTVFEKNEIVGRKLRLTGNGRCNYSNEDLNLSHYEHSYGHSNPDFLDAMGFEDDLKLISSVIGENGREEFTAFLESCGILTTHHNEYYYPFSERAGEMTDTLFGVLKRKGIEFKLGTQVQSVTHASDGKFEIEGEKFDALILATGGKAAPKTGSDGSGYRIARCFGHTVTYTYPVLVALNYDASYGDALAGIRCRGLAKGIVDEEEICSSLGEIQFTKDCVSGIPVFQLSRRLTKPIEEKKNVQIEIDFIPQIKEEDLDSFLSARKENLGSPDSKEFFAGMLPEKLTEFLLDDFSKVDYHETYDSSTFEKRFLTYLKHYRIPIHSHAGYDSAQCTRGGVDLSELDDTLQSKLIPNLYFAGEMTDVDGDCGGYNLQWAFSSGKMAGVCAAHAAGDQV